MLLVPLHLRWIFINLWIVELIDLLGVWWRLMLGAGGCVETRHVTPCLVYCHTLRYKSTSVYLVCPFSPRNAAVKSELQSSCDFFFKSWQVRNILNRDILWSLSPRSCIHAKTSFLLHGLLAVVLPWKCLSVKLFVCCLVVMLAQEQPLEVGRQSTFCPHVFCCP